MVDHGSVDERGRGAIATLVLVALVGAALYGVTWFLAGGRPSLSSGPLSEVFAGDAIRRSVAAWFRGGQMPTPSVDAQSTRILPKVAVSPQGGTFGYLRTRGGKPVAYSPCRRLEVVTNLRGAPPGAQDVVRDAVGQISDASGLSLTVAGTTRERYSPDREAYQPDRYGDRWAPILIDWGGARVMPQLGGSAIGFGGSVAIDPALGDSSYVTGAIVLDRTFFADPANRSLLLEVVLHELGHVVGLDHVTDEGEVMWEGGVHGAGLGPGDREGLARLGRGPCTPDL